jgi:hypothetical protein
VRAKKLDGGSRIQVQTMVAMSDEKKLGQVCVGCGGAIARQVARFVLDAYKVWILEGLIFPGRLISLIPG